MWPLIPVAEWAVGVVNGVMRSVLLAQGEMQWPSDGTSSVSASDLNSSEAPNTQPGPTDASKPNPTGPSTTPTLPLPLHLLLVLHPLLRSRLLRLLAQLSAFRDFVSALDVPILQPESRFAPGGTSRDPRATILARERIRDLGEGVGVGVGAGVGVGVGLWGRSLAGLRVGEWLSEGI